METLILGWYVLVETGSVLLLTLFGALQFAGTLIAPMFGVAGDRIGHRTLLCAMRAAYAVLAAILMAVAFAGALTPLLVFVIAGLNGLVRPSDLGVRIALVADNIPSDQLVAAMGISRTTSDFARVGGALAGAGMFAAFGMGPAYVAVASFYALGLLLTLAIAPAPPRPQTADAAPAGYQRPSAWRDLSEGLAYVWSKPQLLAAMSIAFLVNMTAYPQSNGLLPYVAKDIYRIDQTGLGYLVASFAFGALLGSVALTLRGSDRPARLMILSALGWYSMLLLFAQMPGPYGAVVMLALAGFMQSLCMVTVAVLLLRVTAREIPRPRHGRAHARHLQPAAGPARRRHPHRPHRLSCHGNALFRDRPAVHAAHRPALAHRLCAKPTRRQTHDESRRLVPEISRARIVRCARPDPPPTLMGRG